MADVIVGYAPKLVEVDGNDLYWSGDEALGFSWEDLFTTSHYVANTSLGTPTSQAIAAIDGVQSDGRMKITVADATDWLPGHRCVPQRQSAINWYTTVATAQAGLTPGDSLLMCFSNTSDSQCWNERFGVIDALYHSVIGMTVGLTFFYTGSSEFLTIDYANLNGFDVIYQDFTIYMFRLSTSSIPMETNGTTNGSMTVRRITAYGGYYGFVCGDQNDGSIHIMDHCVAIGQQARGFTMNNSSTTNTKLINCTSAYQVLGINVGNQGIYMRNCLAIYSSTNDFSGLGHASLDMDYCASMDGTANVGAHDQPNLSAVDIQSAAIHQYLKSPMDPRIARSSPLVGAGIADGSSGSFDIDGNAISDPPSIGASEGVLNATLPTSGSIDIGETDACIALGHSSYLMGGLEFGTAYNVGLEVKVQQWNGVAWVDMSTIFSDSLAVSANTSYTFNSINGDSNMEYTPATTGKYCWVVTVTFNDGTTWVDTTHFEVESDISLESTAATGKV